MRPKLVSLLAFASITLVGCSTAGTDTDPAVPSKPSVEESVESYIPADAPAPSVSADPEEAFIEAATVEIERHADYFEYAVPSEMLTKDALIERGKKICDLQESGKLSFAPKTDDEGEAELEKVIRIPATSTLCPAD